MLGRYSGLPQFLKALPDARGLGLQVLQVLLERCRLFLSGRKPAVEAEGMRAAPAVLPVVPTAAAAVLPVMRAAVAVLPVVPTAAAAVMPATPAVMTSMHVSHLL